MPCKRNVITLSDQMTVLSKKKGLILFGVYAGLGVSGSFLQPVKMSARSMLHLLLEFPE